jgi:hypothetical protein
MQQQRKIERRTFLCSPLLFIGQLGGIKLPQLNKIPGADKLLKQDDPLTTSLADAYPGVPLLDTYRPTDTIDMPLLPTNDAGEYLWVPGLYALEARSYCLKAGTVPPKIDRRDFQGDGYLFAPLKGPQAGVVERILTATVQHPEVPQFSAQLLLWSIIAGQKLGECPKEIRETAAILLSERDRRGIDDKFLGVVPPELRERVYSKLPPLVREAMEAENKMRALLSEKYTAVTAPAEELVEVASQPGQKVSALYAQMEELAMRVVELPPAQGNEKIPAGRWVWHPEGYFLRITPSGYALSQRLVYRPESFELTQEKLIGPESQTLVIAPQKLQLGETILALASPLPAIPREAWSGKRLEGDAKRLVQLYLAAQRAEDPNAESRPISEFLARALMSALAGATPAEQPTVCSAGFGGWGGSGAGGAGTGRAGNQRLGQSNVPSHAPSVDKARAATKALQEFGGHATSGLDLPFAMVDALLSWQFNMTDAIGAALNGENVSSVPAPGRSSREPEALCFLQEPVKRTALPRPKQTRRGDEPLALVEARQALSDALAVLCEAGSERLEGERRFLQSRSAANGLHLVTLRKHWGEAMRTVATAGEALLAAFEKAGGQDLIWNQDAWSAYRTRLMAEGFTSEERSHALAVGFTLVGLDALLTQKRRLTLTDMPSVGNVGNLKNLCLALRESGEDYSRLPALPVGSELGRNTSPL